MLLMMTKWKPSLIIVQVKEHHTDSSRISYGLRKAFEYTWRLKLLQCLGATKFSGKFYKRFSAETKKKLFLKKQLRAMKNGVFKTI